MRHISLFVFLFLMGFSLPRGVHTTCFDRGVIALSFDDGISPRSLEIAAALEEKEVKATFFVIGSTLAKGNNIWILKQLFDKGHQIASHSWSHPNLTKISEKAFEREILETENGLLQVNPELKLYIRPPYGAVNQETYDNLEAFGYSVVMWNMDLRDWDSGRSEEKMLFLYESIISKSDPTKDSYILVLHEKEHTLAILPKIIDAAKSKGFSFATVDSCVPSHID